MSSPPQPDRRPRDDHAVAFARQPRRHVWSAQCDRCYIVKPLDSVEDWLLTREAVDRHYCKPCTAATARSLINSTAPRRRMPLPLAVAALIGVGILTLHNLGH